MADKFQIEGSVDEPERHKRINNAVHDDAAKIAKVVNNLPDGEWLKVTVQDRSYHEQLRVRLVYLQYKISIRRNNNDLSVPAELYVRRKIAGE